MTRGEAIKDFFCKTILPVAVAALLYCIFRSACVKNGELDYLWLWMEGFSGVARSAYSWAFSNSSPRLPLLITPSIMP